MAKAPDTDSWSPQRDETVTVGAGTGEAGSAAWTGSVSGLSISQLSREMRYTAWVGFAPPAPSTREGRRAETQPSGHGELAGGEQEHAWLGAPGRSCLQGRPFFTRSPNLDLMKVFVFFFLSFLRKWSQARREHRQRFETKTRVPVSTQVGWWLRGGRRLLRGSRGSRTRVEEHEVVVLIPSDISGSLILPFP